MVLFEAEGLRWHLFVFQVLPIDILSVRELSVVQALFVTLVPAALLQGVSPV